MNFDFEDNFNYIKEDEEKYNIEEEHSEKFKMIEPKCLIHGTYIVGENEDGLYIMDQHAAHERVNYERTLKKIDSALENLKKTYGE